MARTAGDDRPGPAPTGAARPGPAPTGAAQASSTRAIAALIRAGIHRQTRYRGAMIGGSAANTVFGLLRASLVMATITTAGGSLGGYAIGTGVTYVWVTQALIGPLQIFYWEDLALRIRTGDIAVDLARPLDLQVLFAAQDAGRALALAIPRSIPPLAVGAITFGLVLPGDPLAYVAGAVSLVLAVGVSFVCRYLVNLTAIWLLDIRGMGTVYFTIAMVGCGLVVPVHWFPHWLAVIDAWTPFPSILQAPADILTGRVSGAGVLPILAIQAAWLGGVGVTGRLVQRAGTRYLVVQGG